MKTLLVASQPQQQPNLIVYFAGWGTPTSAVAHLALPQDYDLLICYDYQNLQLDFDFSGYRQIRVVAWSMGVWVADQVMQNIALTSATAVNGTGLPCHDQFGIPCDIFKGTLASLTEDSRVKFERRICGDKHNFAIYQQLAEPRPFTEIHAELTALYAMMQTQTQQSILWTHALIAEQDRIFPAQNQLAYWQQFTSEVCVKKIQGAHYLFSKLSAWAELWEPKIA